MATKANKEEIEITETETEVTEKPAAKKESKSDAKSEQRIAELEAQVAEVDALKAQLKQMQDMFATMMAAGGFGGAAAAKTNSLDDEVKIVHLVERAPGLTTHIQLTNMAMDMSVFGEERTLDRRQCEELVGKYRKWFDEGIIAFGDGYEQLANKFQVKIAKSYEFNKSDFVQKLGILKPNELEDLYTKLCDGHKAFIVEYFKRKVIEKDPKFMDIHKLELLNRLSDGSLKMTIDEVTRK